MVARARLGVVDLGLQSGIYYHLDDLEVVALGCQLVPFRKSRVDADFHSLCFCFPSIKKAFSMSIGLPATCFHREQPLSGEKRAHFSALILENREETGTANQGQHSGS